MKVLHQYGMVRVRRLLQPPGAYDGWEVNQRPPQVGDVGRVLEIFPTVDHRPDCYIVESTSPDGGCVWLGEFVAAELEPLE
jgi:hypothetical protein